VLLLALDTATPAVTVALHDGNGVVAEATTVDARRHGELLAPEIRRVLDVAGVADLTALTDVAVGIGPGPFTGLRVGLVTARVLGDALGVPVHGVCTLDVLARAAGATGSVDGTAPFAVATDARRREVYWARYADAGYADQAHLARETGPAVDRPADVADRLAGLPVVGAGATLYPDAFPDAREPRHPSAAVLAELVAVGLAAGRTFPPPEPLYLRRPDAVEPGARKPASPLGRARPVRA
jgi:tRNA threonylcarbamoyl adenosine modification protein YeaZ